MQSVLLDTNLLIATLEVADQQKMRPYLTFVEMRPRQRLEVPYQPIKQAIFLLSGLATVAVHSANARLGIGMVGREGMTGLSALLGAPYSPYLTVMQSKGIGLAIEVSAFRRILDQNESIRNHLNRYAHFVSIQAAHNALANAHAKLPGRVARWLLMASDRIDDAIIQSTHEHIGLLLGVRRAGVTEALHELRNSGVIGLRRGYVELRDLDALRLIAGPFYGTTTREYERLVGKPIDFFRTKRYQQKMPMEPSKVDPEDVAGSSFQEAMSDELK